MSRLMLVAGLIAVLLTGCGGDDDTTNAGATSTPAKGTFPVTIQTKLGPAVIPEEPKRVVALDYPSADAAIALGVVPIAMTKVTYVPGDVQEWTKAALRGSKPGLFDTDTEIPIEKVAALRPDVILATASYTLDPVYSKLKRIAPVVAHTTGAGEDRWQDSTLKIGRALGREDRAKKLVADLEARVADARHDNASFAGKTVAFFNYAQGKAWAINTDSDFSIRFLSDLSFRLSPTIARLPGDGRAEISTERLGLLNADVVIGTSPSPKELAALEHNALFRKLPAVKRGAYVSLPLGAATSIAFPSPLSVSYALDRLVPELVGATS